MSRPSMLLRHAGALMRPVSSASPLLRRAGAPAALRASPLPSARGFSVSAVARHGELKRPEPGKGIKVTFVDSKGNKIKEIEGCEGDDLLSLAHEHDVDLEGACERSVACSTCHVVLDPKSFDKLAEADDEENDMLDLAFGLEDTSRLGCQVLLKPELDGMVARLPAATRNFYAPGTSKTHGS